MDNSTQAVLKHLKDVGPLTSMEAFQLFGVTRLSAKIFDLRKKGYIIDTIMLEGTTRFKMPCRYAKYVYKGREGELDGTHSNDCH